MKINGLKSIVGAAIILVITWSCQKEEDFFLQNDNDSKNEILGMTKLGKQLENPYSVKNMRKAFDNLKFTSPNNRISGDELEITTSHYYIKFIPKNEDELSILKRDSTLILFEYPLDYEILEGGTHFRDPSIPIGTPTFQYVSLPIDNQIPDGVEYEILENLYIPDEEKNSNISNGRIAKNELIDLLVEESLRLTGNLNDVNNSNSRIQSSSWRPAGRIQLFDDELGRLVGVHGVKVRARRWFTTHEGYTDINGNFTCNGTFKRDANYSIPWERYDFDIRSGSLGQAVYDGPKKEGNWNLEIRSGASRMFAIVFQACYNYYYGNRLGLKSPPQNSFWKTALKLSVWDETNPDANGSHCKDCRFLGISSRIRIWNNGGSCMAIYATTIHELAHASHWELRRNNWNDSNTETKVKESWTRGVQWALGRLRYPNYRGGPTIRPDYTQVVVDMIDPNFASVFANENFGLWNDNVTGYTIKQIEDVLSNTSTWQDWENNIRNTYNNATEANLQALFTQWD